MMMPMTMIDDDNDDAAADVTMIDRCDAVQPEKGGG